MDIRRCLDSYLLEHDVRDSTAAHYRRCVSVFRAWVGGGEFSSTAVSRFLLDLQQSGKSSYYRRSLRSALVAILRHAGDDGRVRPVKLHRLSPERWTGDEITRLIGASRQYRWHDSTYWPTLIAAGWHTGLNQCDLERLERRHFANDGTLRTTRSKTGRVVVTWLPPDLLAERPSTGLLWKRSISAEMFRRHFAAIVAGAGLTGTFKRLRKSSGTAAEERYPGRGHEHLGNSRPIFERHYLSPDAEKQPLRIDAAE